MTKEQTISRIREKLDEIVGQKYLYGKEIHTIKGYTIHSDRERAQIHTDKRDYDRPFDSILDFIHMLKPAGGVSKIVDVPLKDVMKSDQPIQKIDTPVRNGHTTSDVIVYLTTDYSRFNLLTGNRKIDERKVNRIIGEIRSGNDMLSYYPIQVRESKKGLDVLDGQHRLYIAKKMKRPVHYILVSEEKSMPDIAKVNSNVEKWKTDDFINCFSQHGNDNYVQIRHFMTKYNMALSVTLNLLSTGNPGVEGMNAQATKDFQNGTFLVTHWIPATTLAENCKLFSSFPNWRSRAFVIAIYRIRQAGLITIQDLLAAYNKRPDMLTEQANYKAYVNILEQIVNVGKQKRIVII